jgi:GNAT superfamily N-acetyltransferase
MPPIDYAICTAADSAEMARLLGDVFSRHEPPAVAMGITAKEFVGFVELLCPKADSERLTIVARSAETGEMLGALLAEDAAAASPAEMHQLGEKFEPIFDILGELNADYRAGREFHEGECVHIFLLGVSASATGIGIAQQLVARCLANAASRGYRVAITEATGKTSHHVFRRHGFVERARRSYADHRYRGEAVFASVADQGGPILMERQLSIVAPELS